MGIHSIHNLTTGDTEMQKQITIMREGDGRRIRCSCGDYEDKAMDSGDANIHAQRHNSTKHGGTYRVFDETKRSFT